MAKIRKALVAAAGAAAALVWGEVQSGGIPHDTIGWSALLGSAVAAGVAAGYATWRVTNTPPAA